MENIWRISDARNQGFVLLFLLITDKWGGEEAFNYGDITAGRLVDQVQFIHGVEGEQLVTSSKDLYSHKNDER